MTIDTAPRIDQITLVGTLETQKRYDKDVLVSTRYNSLQGRDDQISVQVLSPYGTPFRQVVHLEGSVAGRELLDEIAPGTPLAIDGVLEWTLITDGRYALSPMERGRQFSEITIRAQAIRLATSEDEPGGDVWLQGRVLTPIRILRHVEKPIRIATTTLQIMPTRTRKGSRARLLARANVPVTIPLDHPDAEALFRPGNEVIVEGMLERVTVLLNGQDVERAVAALDSGWETERASLGTAEQARRERAYGRQRWRLLEGARTRVVAGYVELIEGTPATLNEGLAIRREQQRQRVQEQRERRERTEAGAVPTVVAVEPSVVAGGIDPAAGTMRMVRPRRRAEGAASTMEELVMAGVIEPEATNGTHTTEVPSADG